MVEGNFPMTSIISSFLFFFSFLFRFLSVLIFVYRFISSSNNDVESQRNPYRSNRRIDRICGMLMNDVETDRWSVVSSYPRSANVVVNPG